MKKLLLLMIAFVLTFFGTVVQTHAAEDTSEATIYESMNVGFLGDSITAGNGTTDSTYIYTALMDDALNFANVYNYGVSGSRLAKEGDRTDSFYERYTTMEADLDLIFVYGGVNDFQTGDLLIGTATDAVDTTLYGNINLLMDGLESRYPDAEIVFITPYNYETTSFDSKVANATSGLTLDEINAAIEARAAAKGISVISLEDHIGFDLYTDGDPVDTYTSDELHLNDAGHRLLSHLLISYLQRTELDYFNDNLINFDTITEGYELSSGGPYYNGATTYSFFSDYIKVEPGKSYVAYSQLNEAGDPRSNYVLFYDEAKSYVSMPTGTSPHSVFVIPEGVEYIRVNGSIIEQRLEDTYVREIVNYPVYKVEFHLGAYSEPESIWVEAGELIVIEEPTNSYNTFAGWYADSNLTQMFDIFSDVVNQDLTLYARWILTETSPTTDSPSTGGTITVPTTSLSLWGIQWYWYAIAAVCAFWLFGTKDGKRFRKKLIK